VQLRRIIDTNGGGNASLGMAGIAIFYTALGDHEDAALLLCKQGTVQSGNPAADYDVIVSINVATSDMPL
jgi:hypothetical protein